MRTYYITQGTLLNSLWWQKCEGTPKKRGATYIHMAHSLRYTANSNTKIVKTTILHNN